MKKLLKHLQKSVSLLMLLAYSIVLLTPLIALADEHEADTATDGDATEEQADGDTANSNEETIEAKKIDPAEVLAKEICSYDTSEYAKYLTADENKDGVPDNKEEIQNNCGVEPNKVTGYIEKGDCTAAGKVITELQEGFAANSNTGEAVSVDGNSVVNLYKGACCFSANSDGVSCETLRFIYTTDFNKCSDKAINCEKVQWIIGESGIGIVKVFVKLIYVWGAGVAGFIAVTVIVISGIQISVSGISGDISSAKNRIMQSLAGLVLIFLSGVILYVVNPTFFS